MNSLRFPYFTRPKALWIGSVRKWQRFSLCVCLLMACHGLSAQVPGYLGKRALVNLDINTSPAIAYGIAEGLWAPNFRAGLNAEYVLSRRTSGGLSAYAFTTRARYSNDTLGSGNARINSVAVGVQLRFYNFMRRGNIAPLGPYHKIEVLYLRYAMKDLDGLYYADGRTDLGNYGDVAFTYTFGTQRILTGNFTYNLGIQVGTLASIFSATFVSSAPPEQLGAARLIRHFSLNFNAGIGLIIF